METEHIAHDEKTHAVLWHVQDLVTAETTATVARGFRGGVGLEAVSFLRHVTTRIDFEDAQRRPITLPGGDIHHRDQTLVGAGDPWLLGVIGRPLGGWAAAARLGVTLPLGRTEENPFELGRRGLPHQHIQFGTGTFDPLLGASAGRRFGATAITAGAILRLPRYANGHGYRAGTRLGAALGLDRGLGGRWRGQAGLDFGRESAEAWDGRIEEEGNLGRSDLLASVGIAHPLGARVLVLTLKLPVRTRSSGVQIDYPALLVLGWSR